MSNNIVLNVPSYFKIISMIIYLFTVLICFDYLGIMLLFLILLFISLRSNIELKKYHISFFLIIFLFVVCFSLHLQYIYIFKILLVISYFKYLMIVNNCLELDNSLTRIFKYRIFILIKKYRLFKENYGFFVKSNMSIYNQKKIFNSLYLAYKKTEFVNIKDYIINKQNKTLYSYLFVLLHFVTFLFVFLLEVYV